MILGLFAWSGSHHRLWRQCGIVTLSLCVHFGQSSVPVQAVSPTTPEEINRVRVYKHIARSTVLIASAYLSRHHMSHASWRGLGSGVLIDDQGSILTNAHVVDSTAKITVPCMMENGFQPSWSAVIG